MLAVICQVYKLAPVNWYGKVDLYSAIITKVSIALNTLVSGEKPGFQALSKGRAKTKSPTLDKYLHEFLFPLLSMNNPVECRPL